MVKSGLVMGAVMLVLALAAGAIITPLCTPCIAIFIGLGAGYLAGVFDKPALQSDAFRKGAVAGTIAGIFGIIGQVIAALVNATLLPQFLGRAFHQPNLTPQVVLLGQLGTAFCVGLFNILLLAGLGVGGAAFWYAIQNRTQTPPPPSFPQQV